MKIKLFAGTAVLAAASLATMSAAHAGVVSLNFENIISTYPGSATTIGGYYDGGVSGDGTTGTNYGITFSANAEAFCLNSLTVSCSNTSRGGLAPGSSEGALVFYTGSSATLDYAAGFTNGFSFNYAEPNTSGGNVQVFSGLDGSGTLLASISLSLTPSTCAAGYNAAYCPFVPIGVTFAGTAESIEFGGVANYVTFDDVTFGSSNPGGVPEPATWAMMLVGAGAVGASLRMARRKQAALTAA